MAHSCRTTCASPSLRRSSARASTFAVPTAQQVPPDLTPKPRWPEDDEKAEAELADELRRREAERLKPAGRRRRRSKPDPTEDDGGANMA
jgi:hypothetical protein